MPQLLTHVANTLTSAVTTFESYPFNSMVEFNGVMLGASTGGLFKLDDAASAELPLATMATGAISFRSDQQKRCDNFYLAMRADGAIVLRVYVDEQDPYEYEIDPLTVETLKQRRSLIGKGLRGKYWKFELECADDFDFDTMGIAMVPTSRRV